MLCISSSDALARALSLLSDDIRDLLQLRQAQLGGEFAGHARLVVPQPGDGLDALEKELRFSVFRNPVDGRFFGDPEFSPGWEWVANHGHAFELVFIFDDSGFAHVVIIPNEPGIEPELLCLCRTYAD